MPRYLKKSESGFSTSVVPRSRRCVPRLTGGGGSVCGGRLTAGNVTLGKPTYLAPNTQNWVLASIYFEPTGTRLWTPGGDPCTGR